MFHYYVDQPTVPQKVIEKRWQQDIEGKIDSLEEYKKEIDKGKGKFNFISSQLYYSRL